MVKIQMDIANQVSVSDEFFSCSTIEQNLTDPHIAIGNTGRSTQWLVGDVFLKSVYFATEVER